MGIKGKDFVVVVSDTTATQQIITIKHDEDKLVPIDDHKLMCLSGWQMGSIELFLQVWPLAVCLLILVVIRLSEASCHPVAIILSLALS